MSYVVFALKWRPNNFDEIVGQNSAVITLKNAIQKGRLAHAYLFAGPRGVGKTSTARILARALNCKNGPTPNPCGKCPACLEISQGRSLDVIEIDGASNRGIDEIRTLRENVKFAPSQGRYKIYIIDEVHQITSEGFNALLKTLEEPPPFVKFIFATTHPHKVIPTILSRCQRLDFRRISVMEIIAQLEKIVRAEKIDIDKDVLFALARASDGSLRDAESVLDQLISFSKDKVALKDVISMLGLVEQETLFAIADSIISKDTRRALELMNQVIDEGKDIGNFLNNLIEHFRNLMVAKITEADARLVDLPKEVCERLLEQSRAFSLDEIFSVFNTLIAAQEMAKRMDSLRIPLELSLIKLTQDKKAGQPASRNSSLPKGKIIKEEHPAPRQESKPAPETQEDPDPPQHIHDTQAIPLDKLKSAWQGIINSLGAVKMSLATYLAEGIPTKMDRNTLTVSFPVSHSLHKETLESKENRALIEKILSESLGSHIRVNFALSKEVQGKHTHDADPFLKSALQAFNGRVIREG